MTSAHVLSIQALGELKTALNRFSAEAQEVLNAAEIEIRRTLDWLQERLNHWRNEVQRRQEEVRRAEVALAHCQASGYRDRDGHYHQPDCSAYKHALLQARVRLQEAEAELHNVQEWIRVVGQAATTYRAQAQRLGRLLTVDLPRANAFLERKVADLQAYLAVATPAAAGVIPLASSAGQAGGTHSWLDLVPREYRASVARAFEGTPEVVTLSEDLIVYRHWGGEASETDSPWFSLKPYVRPGNARRYLALPNRNTAENVSAFRIPAGTTIIRGKAAPQVQHPEFGPYATGGGIQIYVPNPDVVIPLSPVNVTK